MDQLIETKTIAEVAQLLDSLHKTPEYADHGFAMVRVTDIRRGFLDLTDTMKVDASTYEEFTRRYKPQQGDILFSRVGSYGNSCFVNRSVQFCLGQNTVIISPDSSRIDPYYRYCCLNSNFVKSQIEGFVGGASQPTISLANVNRLSIPCPNLPIQHRIASILSAYDDIVENNTRRIKILEEMAQMLYREWFVNFRFPGYQKVKMVESDLGPIPKGWQPKRLGNFCSEVRRSVLPSDVDVDTPYIGLEHLPRKSIALNDWGRAGDVGSTKLRFKRGEILFGKIRPYFHKVGVAPVDGVASSDAIVIVPNDPVYFSPVLCCVSSEDFVRHATQTSQGTKMPRANWDVLIKYPLALPSGALLEQFSGVIRSIVEMLQNLVFRSRNLRTTRDLLLPKLISGEIPVEAAEEAMEQTA